LIPIDVNMMSIDVNWY